MSEPEEVLLDGAHFASTLASSLWRRHTAGPPRVGLVEVRPRLELILTALYGDAPPIVVAEPPARPSLFGRLARRIPRHMVDLRALASTDGVRVRLPSLLDASDGVEQAFARYRLLAVEQVARERRGTARSLPPAGDALTRDLYLLAEAASVDAVLATELPGWLAELSAARARELAGRSDPPRLTAAERELEGMVRLLLAAHPAEPPAELAMRGRVTASPEESLVWARSRAEALRALGGRYRGVRAVALWGRVDAPGSEGAAGSRLIPGEPEARPPTPARVRTLRRRPRVREAKEDEDDPNVGMWMIQIDDPQEHVEDPMGLQRPTDRDEDADVDNLADSFSELPEARLVSLPGTPGEVLASEDPPDRRARWHGGLARGVGIAYPEWDWRIDAYHAGRAVVRSAPALLGGEAWAAAVLRRYAREIDEVRRRFERLRPRRVRLGRQPDGPDVDLGAFVTAYADTRAGGAVDDRLYESIRPTRRDLAISLLVDVSGSTDSWVAGQLRIVDVEKEALLLVCQALDALGDRYNVLAFSGEGPESVVVSTVKRFDEPNGHVVQQRIAALEPDRYTRLGAALRHATALLCREAAGHRLLLVLSDGKPNDVDIYEGRYGIEDARQAVAEARLQRIQPFCVTVDRQAPTYLPRIFGPGGYAVLLQAERLPGVLVEVVRRLLRD